MILDIDRKCRSWGVKLRLVDMALWAPFLFTVLSIIIFSVLDCWNTGTILFTLILFVGGIYGARIIVSSAAKREYY